MLVAATMVAAVLVAGCGGDSDPKPAEVSVSPARLTLAAGRAMAVTATVDGVPARPGQLTWIASPASVATVTEAADGSVLITSKAPGQAKVTATLGDGSGSVDVTVTAAEIDALAVTPPTPTLAAGTAAALVATATLSDLSTRDVTDEVQWQSGDGAIVTVDASGRVQGVSPGAATVTATLGGHTGSAAVTVTDAVLTSIAITPVSSMLPKGLTLALTATGTFSDDSVQNLTSQVTWLSGAPATAPVSLAGVVTGLTVGPVTITAVLGAKSGQASIEVTPAVLQSLAVTPVDPMLPLGRTLTLTATGTYSDTTTADLSAQATWTSSDSAVVSVNGRVATAQGLGSATVSATFGGKTGSTVIEVTPAVLMSLSIAPADSSLARGLTRQLTATGTFSDSSTQDLTDAVTWASSDGAQLSVSNAAGSHGLATALAVGTVTVSASLAGVTGTTTLTVSAAVVTAVAVTPATFALVVGSTRQLTATATFSDASTLDVTEQATWSSSASAVAAVSNATGSRGLVSALAAGSATVTATMSGVSGSATATVTAATLSSIAVTPATASIAVGATQQYAAVGSYSNGSTQDLTTAVTWSSSDANVAQISNAAGSQGLATGRIAGAVTIAATLGAVTGTATLSVTAVGQTRVRLMAGNITSGNLQSYEPGHGGRIFDGLNPDIVMIQEFNYFPGNGDTQLRAWVTSVFGASYSYYRESGAQIPNGVISRFPILAAGTWEDTISPNREFVWARIDVPGAKDLWAISVHLLTANASTRNNQATALRALIDANVPAADYLVIGGDFNTDTRSEAAISTLSSVVSTAAPYPVDQAGVGGTNASRQKPYDWVLMDADLRALQTPVVIGSSTFAAGLVFDSRVYTPLSEVAPVLQTDSGAPNMQHMGVVVDVMMP